jgi:hypothetical protein
MDFEPFSEIVGWNSSPACQRKSNFESCFCDYWQPGDPDKVSPSDLRGTGVALTLSGEKTNRVGSS